MLITCYLASAALFYIFMYSRAPIMEDSKFAPGVIPAPCEVIELFPQPAEQAASRAA